LVIFINVLSFTRLLILRCANRVQRYNL
jgi:hypothetical protein